MSESVVLLLLILCSITVILLIATFICSVLSVTQGAKKTAEIKELLKKLENKPLVAPVVNIAAPARPAQTPVVTAPPQHVVTPLVQPVPKKVPASFSQGEVKLYSVPDKTAAMLMAIVADELNAPINELRFKSIKEISQ